MRIYNHVTAIKHGGNMDEFTGRITWGGSKSMSYVVDNGNPATTSVNHEIRNELVPNGKEMN